MYRTLEAANMDLGLLRDFLLSLSFLNPFFGDMLESATTFGLAIKWLGSGQDPTYLVKMLAPR